MSAAPRSWLLRAGAVFGAVFALGAGLALSLGTTEAGLRWLVAAVNAAPITKVRVHVEDASGTLVGGFSIGAVHVASAHADVDVHQVAGVARFWPLLEGVVALDRLSVGQVRVAAHRVPTTSTTTPKFLPRLLRLDVAALDARNVDIVLTNGVHLVYGRVSAAARVASDRIAVRSFEAQGPLMSGAGDVQILAARPIALAGDIKWRLTPPRQPAWSGGASFRGDLDRLAYSADIATPFRATSRGELTTLTHEWNWRGTLVTQDFDVRAWKADSKLGPVAAVLDVGGDRTGYFASGSVTPRDLPTGQVALRYRGRYHERTLYFDEIQLRPVGAKGALEARGTIRLTGAAPQLDFAADWRDLQWPVRGTPVAVSDTGRMNLAGTWPLRWQAVAALRLRDLPAAQLTARGELASGRITVAALDGSWLEGGLSGSGELHYGERAGWSLSARGSRLNPAVWRKDWAGSLDVSVRATASGLTHDADWQVQVDQVRGRLRGQRLVASGTLHRIGEGVGFEHVVVDLGSTHLRFSGHAAEDVALDWDVTSPDLSRTVPGAAGRIDSRGRYRGRGAEFTASGTVDASGLGYGGFSAARLRADVALDLAGGGASHATLSVEALGWSGRSLDSLQMELSGTAAAHAWRLDARAGELQTQLGGSGRYTAGLWSARLEHWTLASGDAQRLSLEAPSAITIGAHELALSQACLASGPERLCTEGVRDAQGSWGIRARADQLPLKAFGQGLPGRPEFDGALAMQIEASGRRDSPWTGTARLDLSDAVLRYRLQRGQRQTLTLGAGHAELLAAAGAFSGTLQLRATEKTFIDADLSLSRLPGRALVDQVLAGRLRAQVSELGLIPLFITDVDRVEGGLSTDLRLGGTPRAPNLDGALDLDAGAIDFYSVNLRLRDTRLAARLEGNALALDGTTHAGGGRAAINGRLAWNGGAPSGMLRLSGDHLQIVDVPEVRIVASPDLTLRIAGRRIDVDGTVSVPFARIAPVELTGAVLASSDEVLLGARATAPEERFQVYSRLRLVLGNDVRVDTYGLAGRISGQVDTSSSPGDPGTGVGELKVEEGKYTVLARRLDVDRGRLLFNGGPLSNPGIDLRAVRHLADIVVGANVRGTLREPTLSFFSDPPVPQTQIVSLLVAGGTLESLRSGQTQLVGGTRQELLAQGGAILASQLGAQLGLEDVTVESNDQNQAAVVLGKYLSPRLYVSYGVSLAEAINTLKVQYTLGDRWTIKTEAGENRSIDILFTIEK